MLAQLSMPEFQTLADNGWCFSSLRFCSLKQFVAVVKSNHTPTTLGCHGNIFGYVEAQAFTYSLVSSKFLDVKIFTFMYQNSQMCGILLSRLQAL